MPLSQGNDGKKAEKGALKVKTIKRNYSCVGPLSPAFPSLGRGFRVGSGFGTQRADGWLLRVRSRRPEGDKLMDYLVRPASSRMMAHRLTADAGAP